MSDFDDYDEPPFNADRDRSILWARELLTRTDWVIFDTETTGLRGAEIVQIGLLLPTGAALIDQIVRPRLPIEPKALATHGITQERADAGTELAGLLPVMAQAMHGREVVVYNAGFDKGILHGCLRRRSGDAFADQWIGAARWSCAMLHYAAFVGELRYDGDYKYQPLPGATHGAIGDCRAALKVIQRMAAAKVSTEAV